VKTRDTKREFAPADTKRPVHSESREAHARIGRRPNAVLTSIIKINTTCRIDRAHHLNGATETISEIN
jgi:hypothetical protein